MINKLLDCVMDLGESMLLSGAEIFRVEDSINRIFYAYDIKRSDVFIINSSMVVSVYDNDGNVFTQTRRIYGAVTDIDRLDRLNSLSRKICEQKMSPDEIAFELDKIKNAPHFPFWLQVLATALISASFTLFFGGHAVEALISGIIGAVIKTLSYFVRSIKTNLMLEKFISAFFLCTLAFLTVKFSLVSNPDKIIIGNIMYMIPGIGFTNALRDLFKGDIFAGVHRTIESMLISISIAAGYIVTVILFNGGVLL